MDGVGGRPGWAYLFIIEGTVTIAFGLACYFLLPNSPTAIPLLTDAERKHMVRALHADGIVLAGEVDTSYTIKEVFRTFLRPHVLLVALAGFFSGTTVGGLGSYVSSVRANSARY